MRARVLLAGLGALLAACGVLSGRDAPARSPDPVVVQRAPPPATLPPTPLDPGPAPGVFIPPSPTASPIGADRAKSEVDRILGGQLREDMRSLMTVAAQTGDEAQRYQAYLGAWQHLRDEYFAAGQPAEYRAALGAIEAVARSFPQYAAGDFELRPT